MKTKITLLTSFLMIGFLFSCESLIPEILSTDVTTIVDDEIISLKSDDIGDEDSQAPMFEGKGRDFRSRMMNHRFSSDCASVTESGEDYPKEIVIDYGEGCENRKGDLVSGKIVITMTAEMHEAGAIYEMTYVDFFIGERKVEMVKTKTNQGQNDDGNWVMLSSQEKTITYEDGSSSTRNSNETTEWLAGYDTEEKEDNIFYRTGSGQVVTSEGDEYTREITTALLFDGSCDYIKSGVIELNKAGEETVIDFGDGECDEWATVTKDGETEEVDLSERGRKGKGFKGNKGKGDSKGKGKGKGKG